jgi:kinesin family protein 4/21/27
MSSLVDFVFVGLKLVIFKLVLLKKWQIFKEEVFDLLDPNASKGDCNAKFAVPARVPIQIRETLSGGITLAGVTEPEVKTKEEMSSYLSRGSMSRATGCTNMNSQSRYTNVNIT